MIQPRSDRPRLPASYGEGTGTLLSWSDVAHRLSNARNYWVNTVDPSGAPHARPLWGVWLEDRFYLEGNPAVSWVRNIRDHPRAEIHLDDSENVVIVDGSFADVPDVGLDLYDRILAEYDRKYGGYRPPDPEDRGFYIFTPSRAFAWTAFPDTATRFTWNDAPETG